MRKKLLIILSSVFTLTLVYFLVFDKSENKETLVEQLAKDVPIKKKKKTMEEKMLHVQERLEYEWRLQRNPLTGELPEEEKKREMEAAILAKEKARFKRTASVYTSRGPSNKGGRTRTIRVDLSDNTSNTILAAGVTGGLFRTTNGGASWTKVSPNDEPDNVTALAQDPRPGNQNVWYYGTGEWGVFSSSVGVGADAFTGKGIWKSVDNGITWAQIPATDSVFESFDSAFDFIISLEVSPVTGELFVAATGKIYRYDGTTFTVEVEEPSNGAGWTDVVINSSGRVFAAIEGSSSANGVYTSATGNGSWTRIAQNGTPTGWSSNGRITLATAPSNDNIIYALYRNGNSNTNGDVEADLWHYNLGTDTWTNYTSKMPDEPGGDLSGNDPFSIQGGYDLVVSVKPDDENFVLVGGTNVYRISNITSETTFSRIGGYASNSTYSPYTNGGDEHHPDIHELYFDPHDSNVLYSGTDGGVHQTSVGSSKWTSLNNNYQTYQYYHVALDHAGGNVVVGGTQDNGSSIGGTDAGLANNTEVNDLPFGGDGVAVGLARRNGGTDTQVYWGTQNGNACTNLPNNRCNVEPTGSSSQFVTYFYVDPDNTETMYYVGRDILYRTNDAETVTSDDWDTLGSVSSLEDIQRVAATRGTYNPSDSYLLIGGDKGGIFRFDDPHNISSIGIARNITPKASTTNDGVGATTADGTIVSGLAIHPTNPDIVLATYANYGITNIFLTTNATASNPSWTVVERNLASNSIRSAAIAEVNGQTIYFVGTYRGLYSSTDPTTTDWEIEAPNEIGFALVSSIDYRPSDNKLLVGTHGNGMFETTVVANTLSTNDIVSNDLGAFVYPNPVQSELNISASKIDLSNHVAYQISDLSGKLIKRGTLKDQKVDVENLAQGLYIINLESKGLKGSIKFLKQ